MSEVIRDPPDDLRAIARKIIHDKLAYYGEDSEWELYPDIGEHDWERIEKIVNTAADAFRQSPIDYDAAYKRLAERATDD